MIDQEKITKFLDNWIIDTGHKNGHKDSPEFSHRSFYCQKCNLSFNLPGNYFDWDGFGALWEKARESRGWKEFVDKNGIAHRLNSMDLIYVSFIDPQVFPVEWAKFLGWKEGK